MDALLRNRLIAGGLVVGMLVYGGIASGSRIDESRARVAKIRKGEQTVEQAQASAMARELRFKADEGYFFEELEADFKALGVAPVSQERLRAPNPVFHEIERPVVLRAGKTWSSPRIKVRASIERVLFQQHGAKIAAKHAVATVTNTGTKPIAYFMRAVSADRGECPTRGARAHNAMALLPRESAEVVVCAGSGKVEIRELKVMEVTPIGYAYVSKVPPQAVGYDATTSRAHRPGSKVRACSSVPAVKLAGGIERGEVAWEDVVDFYSRHNCERFQYVPGYTRATEPVSQLPVTQAEPAAEPAP